MSTNFESEADVSALPDNDEAENYLSVFTEMIESLGHEYGEQPAGTISIDHETKIVTGKDTDFTDDGEMLCDKLKEFNLGVKTELIEDITIDAEWFTKI